MSGTIPVSALLEILAAKDAEIERLKKEKDELAEKLRRSELDKENSAGLSEPIEQISGRNLDDVWSAINELKRRQDEPEVQIIEDPTTSAKRIRLDPSQAVIDELKEKIERVQKEAQVSINNLRKQYADINNQQAITKTPVNKSKPGFTILLIGGRKNKKEFAGPLVLSSDRSKWLEVKLKLPYIVFGCGVVYYNEELYLIGGWNNLKALYKLNKNRKWIRLTDMNIGRCMIVNRCIAWNGYIWVFGGEDERKNVVTSIERYNPKANKWKIVQDMKHARESVPVIVWKNRIVLVESDVGTACPKKTATAELLNPDGSWTKLPNLPKRRIPHPTISYKEKIIIMGGHEEYVACNSVWELDPHKPNSTWSALPSLKIPANWRGGAVLDGKIYAIGGSELQGRHLDRVEIFNGEQWLDGPSLPYPIGYMSAVIIPQHLADRLCT